MSVNALQSSRDPVVENVVLDGMSEHVCQFGRDGTLTYVNAAFAAHYGLVPSEFVGHCVFDFMAAAERVDARARAALLSPDAAGQTYEQKSRSAAGETAWWKVTDRAVFDANTEAVTILSVRRDITQDKRFDLALERLLQIGMEFQFDTNGFVSEVLQTCLEYLELDLGLMSVRSGNKRHAGAVVSLIPQWDERALLPFLASVETDLTDGERAEFADRTEPVGSSTADQFELKLRVDIPVHCKDVLHGNLILCNRENRGCAFNERHRFFVRQVASVVAAELLRCGEIEDLKQSERELSFIFDNTPARLWFKDCDNRVLRANRAAAQWIGKSQDDLVGRTTDELFKDDLQAAHRKDLEVLKTGIAERNVVEINGHNDTDSNWIQVDKVPYEDAVAGTRNVLTAAIDISELKTAEASLRNVNDMLVTQRESFRRHYRQTPAMLHSTDDTGCLIEVSEKWLSTFGYERDEVIGRRPSEFLEEKSRKYANDVVLPAYFRDGCCNDVPYQFVRKDGSLIDIELSSIMDYAGLDKTAMSFTVLADVTERNQARIALELKNSDLEGANESLRQFAYVASHDLQEPLRKIQTFSDLVQSAAADGNQEELDYAIDVIVGSATRARQLISDLLNFSRTSNRFIERQPLVLQNILSDVLGDLEETISSTAADVRVETGDTIVDADPTLLSQLLQNLLSNALKYQEKGVKPEVLIGVERNNEDVTTGFFVKDNGIGIDPQFRDAIWEPFKRLHTRKSYSGTGIGLAICASVAKRHDWQLDVHSEPDRGSTFVVRWIAG